MISRLRARLVKSSLVALFILNAVPSSAQAGVILQGFYWDAPSNWDHPWWDRLASQGPELAQAGFTAIWLPPALKSASGGYSVGYDPFDDYDMGRKDQRGTIPTRWGTKTQLVNAVSKLRRNGFEVYLDFVLAHRNGDDGNKNFSYNGALGQPNAGRFPKGPMDFWWENSIFGRSLNHSVDYVRRGLIESGQWQVETLGTQGIRVDHAKAVPAEFLGQFFSAGSLAQQFAFVEYWEENVDALIGYLNGGIAGRAAAFDFALWGRLKDLGNGKGFYDLRNLQSAGLVGRAPGSSITFVENHDTDQAYPTRSNKHLGYAYILTSEGYPSVFYKDYYVYGMKDLINNLVWIHERLASGSTLYRWADPDLLVYERQGGSKLLVGLNDNMTSSRREWVSTNFGGFVELQDYTGHRPNIRTQADGRVEIEVGPNSFVAYAPAGQTGGLPQRPSHMTLQTFRGADDLDIPAAHAEYFTAVETLTIAGQSTVSWWLDLETATPNAVVEVQGVSANGKITSLFKGRATNGSVRGDFQSTGNDAVRFEVLVKIPNQPRVPFKLSVKYFAPQS